MEVVLGLPGGSDQSQIPRIVEFGEKLGGDAVARSTPPLAALQLCAAQGIKVGFHKTIIVICFVQTLGAERAAKLV